MEDLIRTLLDDINEPTAKRDTSKSFLGTTSHLSGSNITIYDYMDFFVKGLLEEFQSENASLLIWLDYHQAMFETTMITSANVSMVMLIPDKVKQFFNSFSSSVGLLCG